MRELANTIQAIRVIKTLTSSLITPLNSKGELESSLRVDKNKNIIKMESENAALLNSTV